eukprot:9490705-Pyramimonas_sp.AAC.1
MQDRLFKTKWSSTAPPPFRAPSSPGTVWQLGALLLDPLVDLGALSIDLLDLGALLLDLLVDLGALLLDLL